MTTPKKNRAQPEMPLTPPSVEAVSKQGEVWRLHDHGALLTLAVGNGLKTRLDAAVRMEQKIRAAGTNELFASFLYHGLVHFEREFPLRAQKAKAKKEGRPYVPKGPVGRLEKQESRLRALEAWTARIQAVLEALEKGDMEPAKRLARESVTRNTKLAQQARAGLEIARRAQEASGDQVSG